MMKFMVRAEALPLNSLNAAGSCKQNQKMEIEKFLSGLWNMPKASVSPVYINFMSTQYMHPAGFWHVFRLHWNCLA